MRLHEPMIYFSMKSASETQYTFLTSDDWKGLFVPLVLVPITDPEHERFRGFCEYRKPKELSGEEAVRIAARELIENAI